MKIIVAPDSFKGSLTSMEVAAIMKKACLHVFQENEIILAPMADGGEGTIDVLAHATNGRLISAKCIGPLGDEVETKYGILGDGETVLLEVAKTSGLPMVALEKRDPFKTTTYGLGQMIKKALDDGKRSFIIGLGGSATNDGGIGMLQALGVKFYKHNGSEAGIFGEDLLEIESVSFVQLDKRIKESSIKVACDVTNPLCGDQGASFVFGPQKGGSMEQLKVLDQALNRLALSVEKWFEKPFHNREGAGAAGGLGFAFMIIGAKLESGAKIVSDALDLEKNLNGADLLLTGEGQSDHQTLLGKAPGYIAKMAKGRGVKTVLISGSLGEGYEKLYDYFDACFSIANGPITEEECMLRARELLYKQALNVLRLLKKSE